MENIRTMKRKHVSTQNLGVVCILGFCCGCEIFVVSIVSEWIRNNKIIWPVLFYLLDVYPLALS